MIRLPHFGPFLTATEAGQAVDRLLARFEGLTVQIHALQNADISSEELQEKLRLCSDQVEDACSEAGLVSVVEPIRQVDELPGAEQAAELAAEIGFDPADLGFMLTAEGYVLLRVHMITPDLSKAMTAVRWRRRELAGSSEAPDVVILTMPVPALAQ